MRVRGAFGEALEEFELAQQRYVAAGSPPAAGLALAERAEVLRLRGRYAEADAAYAEAIGFGHDPQPGLALLWLAEGRTAPAVAAVRRLLGEPRDPVRRSQVLAAATEVLLADADPDEASSAADELARVAEEFASTALRAQAAYARGSVAVARSDPAAAVPLLREAEHLWAALDVPFEAARSRVQLGRALRALGDDETARAELLAARQTFAALGAAPAERDVTTLLGTPGAPAGLTAREVEVLRLVATGSSNPEIAAALVLSEKTVARHMSNIFTKLDVRTRTAAAAFAHEQHLV
jgi:DNA-binding NarL/FixJ family response regulator